MPRPRLVSRKVPHVAIFVFLRIIYIFVENLYMSTSITRRKLIDIRSDVFSVLSDKARRKNVSLKRYIEDLIVDDAMNSDIVVPEGVTSRKIISLIGIAKSGVDIDWEEERLKYLLSK